MKPISSATTSLAQAVANSTGSRHGETGSVPALNGVGPRVMHPAVLGRNPSLNTDAVQSRLRQLGVSTSARTELSFPTSSTGVMTWRDKVVGMETVLSSSADLPAALAVAEEALYPAPVEKVEHWLGELSAITARRTETAIEAEISLSAYTGRLRGYPGDIVRDTLLGWSGKWFPTWGELKEIMDERTAPRIAIRDAIQKLIAPPPLPKSKGDITKLKRELVLLEDDCVPFELRYASRDEQVERMAARILELKAEIQQLEKGT